MMQDNNQPNFQPIVPYQEQAHQNMPNKNLPQGLPRDIYNMPDPFQGHMYRNNIPDIPLQDQGTQMLNILLSDNTVPEEVKKNFWFVFHKDNVLTFLDPERKQSKLLNFDLLKIDSLNATPYYNYTFEREMEWNAARQIFETKLDRALGNKQGKNERLTIPMTITENIQRMEDGNSGQVKEGFLKRMLNRR
jgi:hypothetical protein